MSGLLMLLLRWYLARENELRESERTSRDQPEKRDDEGVYLEDSEGGKAGKVDKAFLDLTDIENREFRYVL